MNVANLARLVGETLRNNKLKLVTAESCTGGQVAQIITSISGGGEWFDRGFITYSNDSKMELLKVKPETLEKFGPVSEQTAKEMAEGALLNSHAQVSLAVTGIAGPTGGTKIIPVGTVCFAWSRLNAMTKTTKQLFHGNRESIRLEASLFVIQKLVHFLLSTKPLR
jgi:nicotinamide-nucleotide amidase